MKAESTVRPAETATEKCGEIAEIILCENITEEDRQDGIVYTYDEYRTSAVWRENLLESVQAHPAAWLARAKEKHSPAPTVNEQIDIISEALEEVISMLCGGDV